MSNNENTKNITYLSYEALYPCDFTKEKIRITFEGDEENPEICKGQLIFHPEFGVYKVVKDRFGDDDDEDDEAKSEMILVKTIEDLVKDKETVIIAECGEIVRVFDHDDIDSRFTYFLHNGSEYEEFQAEDVHKFIMRLSKQLKEKENIIERLQMERNT